MTAVKTGTGIKPKVAIKGTVIEMELKLATWNRTGTGPYLKYVTETSLAVVTVGPHGVT